MPESPITDDEAFVRAIVAAPGDDAPRLVYADWLDEHGDPRGDYLRAELEWARPWQSLECPDVAGPTADGLDPLWAVRVSRPPVGVCCDHLRFSDPGPSVEVEWFDEFASRLGVIFPLALRAFLMNGNGGTPPLMGYREKDLEPNDIPSYVGRFHPLIDPREWDDRDNRDNLALSTKALNNGFIAASTNAEAHRRWTSGIREFIAIADGPNTGLYAIGLTARRLGKVYYVNYRTLSAASTKRLVAESLPVLLAMIRFPLAR